MNYYLPKPSHWPIIGAIALFTLLTGVANWIHGNTIGPILAIIGALLLIYMIVGWFGTVIRENQAGLYKNKQVDRSFRLGMLWFIFSEVMFFAAFFGALFYARVLAISWLGGEGHGGMTHLLLWPDFEINWPLLKNPNPGLFPSPQGAVEAWGIPALNTAILLSSGVTITIAHWGIIKEKHMQALLAQGATILLGIIFLALQAHEYIFAHQHLNLTLSSGIFGTTFYMLTGFHGLHVTLGTIMLIVIFFRILKRHFTPSHHFAFEAVAWYWHFVDVVWLFLFVFVYWI